MIASKSVQVGGRELTIETGKIAKQSNGSVLVKCGDTVVLVNAVANFKANDPKGDFLPLTVNYIEKFYAAGKVPGGFLKREGKLSDAETLMARLTDRPIRPLFPEGLKCPIDVVSQVLSADPEVSPDILSMVGASAALTISDIPFLGPIGAVRLGMKDGEFIVNPNKEQLEDSELDLAVAASEKAILMVEAGAKFLSEEKMLEALQFAHETIKPICQLQKELQEAAGKEKFTPPEIETNQELEGEVAKRFEASFVSRVLSIADKKKRYAEKSLFAEEINSDLNPDGDDDLGNEIGRLFHEMEYKVTREYILKGSRIGDRKYNEVRDIACEVDLLPRVHGSSLFTRGETQAIVTTTLGTGDDEQRVNNMMDEGSKKFYLHYNFPGYSVGECKRMGAPGRREIGHGALAERALAPTLPDNNHFPYTIRIVSEITESNGSSSMASVCGGTLSLLNAGVPIEAPIAGIAMGMVKEGDEQVILTDILGDEDHLGDMDFKVTGSRDGITALQMDIKIDGISVELMRTALEQAKEGRVHILDKIDETITKPGDLSEYAPRIEMLKINPDKVRDLIGPGGKNIKRICEEAGVRIDIEDEGIVHVSSPNLESLEKGKKMVRDITVDPQIGEVYLGKVVRLADYGCFVDIKPGVSGLVHISNLAEERVNRVTDIVREGDEVLVKITDIDQQGRIKLSRKDALGQKPTNA